MTKILKAKWEGALGDKYLLLPMTRIARNYLRTIKRCFCLFVTKIELPLSEDVASISSDMIWAILFQTEKVILSSWGRKVHRV